MRGLAASEVLRRSLLSQVWGAESWVAVRCAGTYKPCENDTVSIVRKRGLDVLHDPIYNKGTAFPYSERERLGLRGLLPVKSLSMRMQVERWLDEFKYGRDYIDPANVKDEGITHEDCRRWKVLQELQDRNEQMFYHILLDSFEEMAPIIYTPTVGWACLNYHKLFRRPRGMYFSKLDRGEMAAMTYNWPSHEVDAIVVTDGSRILGLGDQGLNGLGISIGKLDLYVAAAGFHPRKVLPCVVDVGTDNVPLRADPLYMGIDSPRLKGDEYYDIMDEFVKAVMGRWPNAVLQFEDFSLQHAHPLLGRYRNHHLVFNDDIQGTAATACAGVYGALAVQGKLPPAIAEQRFVIVGAGSAGMGVTTMLSLCLIKHGQREQEARSQFWVLDAKGLITSERTDLTAVVQPFARQDEESSEGETLLEVVKRVKPTVLVGLSGVGKLFTQEVLKAMGEAQEQPIIMAMSNPISRLECTHASAQAATGGRAIYMAGSPQGAVEQNGKTICCSQANNMYIFPGLALGAHLAKSGVVSDLMLTAASEALPKLIPEADRKLGKVYPPLANIRAISRRVAADVIKTAHSEGKLHSKSALRELLRGDDALLDWVESMMYKPQYDSLIHLPVGIME
ncbi:hypothetical protein WJX73_006593 [Symbiochloris irregularis]|uniref:Malic enzyme n=1 Tax=Symbiochloris irregularis TaxID=706552 RepID=A0AAW1NNA8_9CHLO